MKRLFFIILFLVFINGCSGIGKNIVSHRESLFNLTNVSKGLPQDGLWRESFVLYDLNGDGGSDILLPPPRKANEEEKRPFIFHFDRNAKSWSEGKYSFPPGDYNYGGIALGDLNKDGLIDIVLASHSSKIFIMLNNGDGSFREVPFPLKEAFYSREIKIADINKDGWLDIVSISEGPFVKGYMPNGILVAINKEGRDWETYILEESRGIFSDSISLSDINGDGNIDIVIAPSTTIKEDKKTLWLGDGKGGFSNHPSDFMGDLLIDKVVAGDIDGDGREELVFILSGMGSKGKFLLKSYRWLPEGLLSDLSSGLEKVKVPITFDLADIDGDKKAEIILLSQEDLAIFKFTDTGWREIFSHPLNFSETFGGKHLSVTPDGDGSFLIVYTLGRERVELNKGIRAYLLNKRRQ